MTESISTSVSTISSSTSTISGQIDPSTDHDHANDSPSTPPSPSIGLPSPPDSPSSQSDSVSSLPSVSSSFFFSSNAASPPHTHVSDYSRDTTQGLIIPHLTLPPAMRRPTHFGKTLGDIRLIVLGDTKGITPSLLFDDNEDVVEIASRWDDLSGTARIVKASSDWIEHKDAHGLEKYEPSHNIEIMDVLCYNRTADPSESISFLKKTVTEPFVSLSELITLKPNCSSTVTNLLTSLNTPLYTALLFHVHSPPSATELQIFEALGSLIPIVPFVQQHRPIDVPGSSAFQPLSSLSLRSGLFHSPDIISSLRIEAAQHFIRWLEVDQAMHDVIQVSTLQSSTLTDPSMTWLKSQWESDINIELARTVSVRLREEEERSDDPHKQNFPIPCTTFDPLHFSSLLFFSFSLLGPIKFKLSGFLHSVVEKVELSHVTFFGGLVAGVGLAILVR